MRGMLRLCLCNINECVKFRENTKMLLTSRFVCGRIWLLDIRVK